MRCAVCQQPIRPAEAVRDRGGLFHPRCLQVFSKYRITIEEAKQIIERKERLAADENRAAAEARVRLMDAEREVQSLRTRLREAEAQARSARERLEQEIARNRRDREEREIAVRRHAELLAENDRVRSELALHRALGPAPAAPATEVADDGKDPAVIRFELLELD